MRSEGLHEAMIVGTTYLLRGERVKMLARWSGNGCPRNVLIQYPDGRLSCRPFRGLRKLPLTPA